MKCAARTAAVLLIAALALWGISAACARRTCGESDVAVAQLLRWQLRERLDGQTLCVIARAEVDGPEGAPFALRAFETADHSKTGLAVFSRRGAALDLETVTVWDGANPVQPLYAVDLRSADQQSIRTYDCFLVLDARIVSVEGARYYGPSADAKALPAWCMTDCSRPALWPCRSRNRSFPGTAADTVSATAPGPWWRRREQLHKMILPLLRYTGAGAKKFRPGAFSFGRGGLPLASTKNLGYNTILK